MLLEELKENYADEELEAYEVIMYYEYIQPLKVLEEQINTLEHVKEVYRNEYDEDREDVRQTLTMFNSMIKTCKAKIQMIEANIDLSKSLNAYDDEGEMFSEEDIAEIKEVVKKYQNNIKKNK